MIAVLALTTALACASAPDARWTASGALSPTRAKLDADGDGRVTDAEYGRVAFLAPAFTAADADGDGDLALAELQALMAASDPVVFFDAVKARAGAGQGPGRPSGPGGPAPRPPPGRQSPGAVPTGARGPGKPGPGGPPPDALYVLLALRDEVISVDPAAPVPEEDVLRAVAMSAPLDSVEARAALAQLEAASDGLHLRFPSSLRTAPAPPD